MLHSLLPVFTNGLGFFLLFLLLLHYSALSIIIFNFFGYSFFFSLSFIVNTDYWLDNEDAFSFIL